MNLENMNRMEVVEKFLSLLESAIHRKAKPKKEYYHRSRLHKSKLHKTRIHKTSMHRDKLYRFRKLDPEKKRVVSKRDNKKQWNQYAKIVEALYEYVYECANEGQRHENRIKEKPEIVKTRNEKIKNYDQTKSKDHSMDLLKHMNERIDALPVMHQLLSFVLVVALIMGFLLNMIEKTLLSVVCVCYSALCLHDLFRFTSHRRKLIMNVERCLDDSIRVSQNEYNHIIEDTNRMADRRIVFGRTSIDIIVLILWSISIGWYKIL